MKDAKKEIISHKDEIECLNDVVDLDLKTIEAISGGGDCTGKWCRRLECIERLTLGIAG